MSTIKSRLKGIPMVGPFAQRLYRSFSSKTKKRPAFCGSREYWEQRYAKGGNSGVGSYGKFAEFKAEVINNFLSQHNIKSVIEFGCGDGNQLYLARYPKYLGLDVSGQAIALCRNAFHGDAHKEFRVLDDYMGETADLALSLDVIYHLVEDEVFENYMDQLLHAAGRFVIIYSSDSDENALYEGTHVKHRHFTRWLRENRPEWKLMRKVPNKYPYQGDYREGSFADFFMFEKLQ
jgi:SAM-dependent methyltransferase